MTRRPIRGETDMTTFKRLSGLATLAVVALALTLGGCAKPKTRYGDPGAVETVTNQFGSTDLQRLAEEMTQSMLQAPVIQSGNLPIVTVQEVRNKTSEYIDTRAITNRIRSSLQKSGRVRFAVDNADMQKQIEELKRQQSQYYDQEKAVQQGRMVGAGYRLSGEITSIVKETEDVKDVYYQLFLSLTNIQTGIEEWSDTKDIRKTTER
ncbi:MAG: penicillin-binding protein activator LpoB [Betaproteobacteria bacterium]|nr:penicillin-binding protein activator LpoB [Betaproteobacteria bacterium]